MHGLHSLQFPPGQSPVVSKIYIYYGNVPLEFRFVDYDKC